MPSHFLPGELVPGEALNTQIPVKGPIHGYVLLPDEAPIRSHLIKAIATLVIQLLLARRGLIRRVSRLQHAVIFRVARLRIRYAWRGLEYAVTLGWSVTQFNVSPDEAPITRLPNESSIRNRFERDTWYLARAQYALIQHVILLGHLARF